MMKKKFRLMLMAVLVIAMSLPSQCFMLDLKPLVPKDPFINIIPFAPTNLTGGFFEYDRNGRPSAQISWTDNAINVSGFEITETDKNGTSSSAQLGSSTIYQTPSRDTGNYQFKVRAYTGSYNNGTAIFSNYSDTITVVLAAYGKPNPPVNFVVDQVSDEAVKVKWESQSDIHGNGFFLSCIDYGSNFPFIPFDSREYTFTGLSDDKEYEFWNSYYYVVSGLTSETATVTQRTATAAPSNLSANVEGKGIRMTWDGNSKVPDTKTYYISRKVEGGSLTPLATTDYKTLTYLDNAVTPGKVYTYTVQAGNEAAPADLRSGYSNDASTMVGIAIEPPIVTPPVVIPPVVTPPVVVPGKIASAKKELRFYVGSSEYYIDNVLNTMDTTPVIAGGRTLLPIKYAAVPLGATVEWGPTDQKITVKSGTKTIELWIGKNNAKINGVDTPIDPNNPSVSPLILPPGRTMLPLRFVTENLGCDLEWNPSTQEVKIITK